MFTGAASAIKNRLRFNSSSSESTALTTSKSTPDLSLKSTVKDPATCLLSISRLSDVFDDNNLDKTATRTFEFREDPSFWNDHNVQVIIRLRPLNSSELSVQGQGRCVRQDCSQSITWTGNPESRFTFDLVADEHVSQEMLFKVAGVPMVENCVGGYNSCMFAYGQTGSGKTHTMLGDIEEGTRRHSVNCGMTPRVFEYLFSRIQKEKEVRREEKIRFTCRCSFLEIYNEHILDLLDPSSSNLQIREDTKKGVYVENLTEVEVTSARDVIQQLVQGAANRKVAATNMNRASSRSHSVFTCVVESKWESQGVTHHRFSRLNLVDLAGSERQKSSGAEGERLKEATNINKSLSTLGLVIMNLVNMTNGKSLHVPYRDSKLTFLLQDSLGGNAKTIIIANISPSSCCSLETLSTLKFAQRAKFIKNNAIVNEDASGDVLAMRAQIENLKKEVGRLRSLHNGGADYHEDDTYMASIPGTPGPFKWDGLNELSTPLTKPHKKTSQNEYEIALVGAFRREKDKDITIQTLTAESQAALLLAKQREDEIQGLRMRLRFREDAIKRLQAVASGKISAETHLLKEKEEHLKEIEVLRNEVSCNPEVTRFAMENLRVKEEIRRLKSFYEEGECERLMEQINILQNKLLEALDWKLMHESNISTVQKERFNPGMDVRDDGFLLSSGQEPASPWHTTLNEENEFLRMQAIHNQSELDALHKRLDLCVLEREKLESHVKDLEAELEAEKALRSLVTKEPQKGKLDVTNNLSSVSAVCDQVELKTMVDAIATASEREAEAHETAITLSKENEQLRMKLKVLLDDNNKLIELYEKAVSENQTRNGSQSCQEDNVADLATLAVQKELDVTTEADNLKQQLREMHEENGRLMALYEKATQKELDVIAEADNLKQQLMELHEENDKLMGLYEKAMQERGSTEADNLKQQLWEIHEENDRLMALYEKASQKELDATSEITTKADNLKQQLVELHEENDKLMGLYEKAMQERSTTEADNLKQLRKMHEENDRLMDLYEKAAQKELDITAEVDDLKQQLIIGLYETAMQEKDTTEADNLKQQLIEMHEENDRLMDLYEKAAQKVHDVTAEVDNLKQQLIIGLYEKAMQEKDTTEADILKQQLREVHEENDRLMAVYEKAMQERGTTEADNLKQQLRKMHEENDRPAQKELNVTAEADNLKQRIIIGLYEKAMQEKDTTEADNLKQQPKVLHEENERLMAVYEKAPQKELDVTAEMDNLKQQLRELHEENDKLMALYEKAMQERDELKRVLVSAEQKCKDIKGESNFPKKLVEGGQSHEFTFIEARSSNVDIISENEAKSTNLVEVTVWEDLNLIRRKLNEAQERLSNSAVSLKLLSSLEKTILEVDELSRDRERLNERIEMKQKSFESSKHLSLALQERRAVLHKKLIALKCSISKFVSSVGYFGQREAQARVRYNSLSASINQKKEELARLEICKGEIMDSRSKMEQSEVELRSNLTVLKVKLEEENRRLEKERVLVTIDNIEKTDAPVLETNWHLTSKATDLLKSEEEIPKLQSQIKKIKEKLAIMKKEAQELDKRAAKVENDIKTVQGGIQDSLLSAEEVCHKLQSITHEKEMVLAMQAEGRKEYENMIREYYECVFEAETSEDEAKILNEDVQMELPKLESLQKAMVAALGRKTQFLEEITRQSCFVSDKIEEELYCVNKSIVEVNSMLADFNSNDS